MFGEITGSTRRNINRTENKSRVMEESEEEEKYESERLWSWGAGTDDQLGTGRLQDQQIPQQISLSSVSSLACGGAHVIVLTHAGKVLSWGRGSSGQLGHGEVVNNVLYPKAVTSLDNYFITHVSAGWSHSGFVSDTGCLFTCGDGSFGQLGHGDYASHSSPVKVSFFVDQHVAEVACGMRHSIVLLKGFLSNQVYGFSSEKRGQLGVSKDKIKSINLPEVISGFEDVEIVGVSANGDHSAALSVDGNLYTWGRGFKGFEDSHLPQCLKSTLKFTKATLGWNHALAMTSIYRHYIQKFYDFLSSVTFLFLKEWILFAKLRIGEGEVYVLGGNHLGVLSNLHAGKQAKQLTESREANLEKVPGLDGTKITDIATGAEHSVLVTENGEIKTWGWGEHGQLGLGDDGDRISPVTVSLGYDLREAASTSVYCGSGFTFALTKP